MLSKYARLSLFAILGLLWLAILPTIPLSLWLLVNFQTAVADTQQQTAIDPNHIYLAGLSNGGLAVSLVGAAASEQFHGLIFISPVMETSVVDSASFLAQWHSRPLLIISGRADKRIPISYIQDRLNILTTAGVDVTSHIYADEDHFLFFARREEVVQQMAQWLQQHQ